MANAVSFVAAAVFVLAMRHRPEPAAGGRADGVVRRPRGLVVWYTLVPRSLLGRVSSVDWLASAALVPVSFAITGPIAGAIGARPTVAIAGISGGLILVGFLLLVPGLRDPERDGSLRGDRMLGA